MKNKIKLLTALMLFVFASNIDAQRLKIGKQLQKASGENYVIITNSNGEQEYKPIADLCTLCDSGGGEVNTDTRVTNPVLNSVTGVLTFDVIDVLTNTIIGTETVDLSSLKDTETITDFTGLVLGNPIGIYTSEDNTTYTINENITSVTFTQDASGDWFFNHQDETKTTTTQNLCEIVRGCLPTDIDTTINDLTVTVVDNVISISVSDNAGQTFSDYFTLVWDSGIIDTTGMTSFVQSLIPNFIDTRNTLTSTDGSVGVTPSTLGDGSILYDLDVDLFDTDTTGLKQLITDCIPTDIDTTVNGISFTVDNTGLVVSVTNTAGETLTDNVVLDLFGAAIDTTSLKQFVKDCIPVFENTQNTLSTSDTDVTIVPSVNANGTTNYDIAVENTDCGSTSLTNSAVVTTTLLDGRTLYTTTTTFTNSCGSFDVIDSDTSTQIIQYNLSGNSFSYVSNDTTFFVDCDSLLKSDNTFDVICDTTYNTGDISTEAFNGTQIDASTGAVEIGNDVSGSVGGLNTGADFQSNRFQYLNGFNYEIGGSINDPHIRPVIRFEDIGDVWMGADGYANANNQSTFYFDRSKGAFNLGRNTTTNLQNFGLFSTSIGINNSVTGSSSFASGNSNQGTADFTTVQGQSGIASAINATISGGFGNRALGTYSTVGGGDSNQAQSNWSIVGGGDQNIAGANYASIFSGLSNNNTGVYATIQGGRLNTTNAQESTMGGGVSNSIVAIGGSTGQVINGGAGNVIDGTAINRYSIINGGQSNTITSSFQSLIGGGSSNIIGGNGTVNNYSIIVGGDQNEITGVQNFLSFIGGGRENKIDGNVAIYSSIVGGLRNNITGEGRYSFIGGGIDNVIGVLSAFDEETSLSFIGGGDNNQIIGTKSYNSCIVGGSNNIINNIGVQGSNHSYIGGGLNNSIGGTIDSRWSFIGNGENNTAEGKYSTILNGENLKVFSHTETALGRSNVSNPLGSENLYISDEILFTLGNGENVTSNAITTLKNGSTQINNTGFNNALTVADVTPQAALEVVSDTQGIRFPNVANTAAVTTPSTGETIFDLSDNKLKTYDGTVWQAHW